MKYFECYLALMLISGTLTIQAQDSLEKHPRCEVTSSEFVLDKPPFKQCHASTLIEMADGSVFAAFFGGSYESANDVKIWGAIRKNDRWKHPFVLADGQVNDTLIYPCWNPVLFKSSQGMIYLFYKVGKNPREWYGMMKTSVDEGLNWSASIALPSGVLGPIKNKPIELDDGNLLCPSSTETSTEWKVQMESYDVKQKSWKVTKVDQSDTLQVIQPTILRYDASTFSILCRSQSNFIITSISVDKGESWSRLAPINLPNPNSGIDGLTLRQGGHLLVYNPLLSGKEWVEGRNRLNLAWSEDGLTWTDILILENEETGEFSYPAIIQSADGKIHITYTHNRTQIKYWKIELKNND
jgi:predicted neuraminidase